MKLEIRGVKERGTSSERLVLVAKEDCDIGKYFVFLSRENNGNIVYTKISYPYWFPDTEIKKGDLIVLYSKEGKSTFKTNKDGTKSYFYYRGSTTPIYTEKDMSLVIEANTWDMEKQQP